MSDANGVGGGDRNDDDPEGELLARLRALAASHDPVPAEAVAAARSAIAWRTMDAELAELTEDSSVDSGLAGVRSTDVPALLTFESANLTVEIEILQAGTSRRLLGQIVPPGPGQVDVDQGGATTTVEADEVGRFRADLGGAGPVRLRCRVDTRVVETDWFLA